MSVLAPVTSCAPCNEASLASVDLGGGIYIASCRGCQVRRAARAPNAPPHYHRDAIFAALPEAERDAFIADTRIEYARLRALGRVYA